MAKAVPHGARKRSTDAPLISPWPVVLASESPRRRELLKAIFEQFECVSPRLDEDALTTENPFETAQKLAREKALEVYRQHEDKLVIAGDTVVTFEQQPGDWVQLAKPTDEADAVRMLGLLSGRTHVVATGVAVRWPGGLSAFTETTKVTFRKISTEEAVAYARTGSPMDKAGAYGLQDESNSFLQKLEGSVSCVIGLPLERLREALTDIIR